MVALVPSSVVNCGIHPYPAVGGCIGAAWTFAGKPLPYTHDFGNPEPVDVPAAIIPVERIRGRILLACAGDDTIWPSCPYANAIAGRIRLKHRPAAKLYTYPGAGHTVGALLPDEPGMLVNDIIRPDDEIAREHLYPHILAFLRGLGRS